MTAAGAGSATRLCSLTGTVLESRHTTVDDFYRAVLLIEPATIGLASTRTSPTAIATLRQHAAELTAAVDDVPQFVQTWARVRMVAFAATRNPVLDIVGEFLHWVSVGLRPAATADAVAHPSWNHRGV